MRHYLGNYVTSVDIKTKMLQSIILFSDSKLKTAATKLHKSPRKNTAEPEKPGEFVECE